MPPKHPIGKQYTHTQDKDYNECPICGMLASHNHPEGWKLPKDLVMEPSQKRAGLPTKQMDEIDRLLDRLVSDLLWVYCEHEDDEIPKIQTEARAAISRMMAEARIDEFKKVEDNKGDQYFLADRAAFNAYMRHRKAELKALTTNNRAEEES